MILFVVALVPPNIGEGRWTAFRSIGAEGRRTEAPFVCESSSALITGDADVDAVSGGRAFFAGRGAAGKVDDGLRSMLITLPVV